MTNFGPAVWWNDLERIMAAVDDLDAASCSLGGSAAAPSMIVYVRVGFMSGTRNLSLWSLTGFPIQRRP